MTAVADSKMYQKFAQTHVDALKNLLSPFEGALRCDGGDPPEGTFRATSLMALGRSADVLSVALNTSSAIFFWASGGDAMQPVNVRS